MKKIVAFAVLAFAALGAFQGLLEVGGLKFLGVKVARSSSRSMIRLCSMSSRVRRTVYPVSFADAYSALNRF